MTLSLLERIADGDQTAVPECISRHGGLVWSMALRLLGGHRADAEDAVQEIFVDLWKHAGRFDPARGSEQTFVATLARRRLIDRRRQIGRRPATIPLPEILLEPAQDITDLTEMRDEADRALNLLSQLPDPQRRVLSLAIGRGMSQSEIARELDLPLGTVKTHARRALQELRDRLEAQPSAQPIRRREVLR